MLRYNLFDDLFSPTYSRDATDRERVYRFSLPGVSPERVQATMSDGLLEIRVTKEEPKKIEVNGAE